MAKTKPRRSGKSIICLILGHDWRIAMGFPCKEFNQYCTHYVCDRCKERTIQRKGWNR